jgi:methyltransferase family protein
MTAPTDTRDCPLCSAAASRATPLAYRSDDFQIVQCRDCDLVYMDRLPPQHEFEDELAWEVSSVSHAAKRKTKYPILVALDRMTRFRMQLIKREPKNVLARHVRPGPIVEVGCGAGLNLTPPPAGFVPYGVEISRSLAAAADAAFRPFGGKCLQLPAEEGLQRFERGFFHGALLIGYIEHEFYPRQALVRLRAALADDAAVVVKTPNFASLNRRLMGMRWSGFRFPDHVNYFTPRTLREIARRAGFTTHYGPTDRNPVSDSLWAVLRAA